jgi:hypothetical protein
MNQLFLASVIVFCATISTSNAQEKYAVLITGDYAADNIPLKSQWNNGESTPMLCFWLDTYLLWEMLIYKKGYSDQNVFVLFADGNDYDDDWMHYTRYDPYHTHQVEKVTDSAATRSNVIATLEGLANGTNGFPQVTEDDFLFVFTFDHGEIDTATGNVNLCLLNNEKIWDYEFAELIDNINAHKKAFWMQQCHSGGFVDDLESTNTYIHTACEPQQVAMPADDYWDDEMEEFIFGDDTIVCEHGEYNFHTYSPVNGESPFFKDHYGELPDTIEPYTDADLNIDNYISFSEAFIWEDEHESWNDPHNILEEPMYSDLGNIGENTSFEYPTLLHSDINDQDGLLVTHRGIIGISRTIHVTSGNQLKFLTNADIYFLNEAKLIIDFGASLILEDNTIVFGTNVNNQLVINGDIEIGDNLNFTSSGPLWDVYLNNNSSQTEIENATFEKCRLHNYSQKLTIKNSTFDNCIALYSHQGSVIVDSTSFEDTWLYIENTEDSNDTATIRNCSFTTNLDLAAIDLWDYDNYYIANNTIDGYYNGIQIMQSGYGQAKHQVIQDNTITNCTQNGIVAYNTLGSLYRNHIYNNGHGVWFGDHSSIRLYGNPSAGSYAQSQEIRDNTSYEVYASQNSFPIYFRYNVIIDEDNLGGQVDPLVYYSVNGEVPPKDVRYNCWGQNFDPAKDLYPAGYIWQPVWCPGIAENSIPTPDEDMYEVANNLFDAENYIAAKSMYEMLIDQYPESKFAKAAMQELFALEKFDTNDYGSLKQYYESNTTLQSDSVLIETGQYLISKCDVKLHNWPDAIGYHENIILNPETLEDSIFAIIDLGYVYFVMENSELKSAYTGKLVQYKPASKEKFIKNRNYLLSLLPGEQMSETMKGNISKLKEGELLQNVPNPFSTSTEIWYKLENESNIQLNIYNYTGQMVTSIDEGIKTKGTHSINFNAGDLKNGIYFYSISINGKTADTKKMTIMN